MATHTVAAGETLVAIARANKTTTKVLQELNPELFERRRFPNLLAPGDELTLPDAAGPVNVDRSGNTRFVVPSANAPIELRLKDWTGAPLAGADYVLRAGDVEKRGKTADDGAIKELVPATATAVELTCGERSWTLQLGALVPITEVDPAVRDQGVEQRLRNLGFADLKAFQASNGLSCSGACDDATVAKLEELHGC
jgi:murein DD-endopeptidase MepM/ murein hydrolase activator NlpD